MARAEATAAGKDNLLGGIVVLGVGVLPVVAGIAIVGWQVVHYLQTGMWVAVSLIDVLRRVAESAWLVYPHAWVGLWKVLNEIPASLLLVGTGIVAGPLASAEFD